MGFLSGKVCRHGVQDALQRGPDIRRVQDQPGCVGVTAAAKGQEVAAHIQFRFVRAGRKAPVAGPLFQSQMCIRDRSAIW